MSDSILDPRVGGEADRGMDQLEHFRRFKVQPPSALYVGLDDVIQCNFWLGDTNATATVTVRYLAPNGEIQRAVFVYPIVFTAPASVIQQFITGIEGFLLSLTVEGSQFGAGEMYARLMLIKGQGTSDVTTGHLLCAGMPSAFDTVGFPQGTPQRSVDGAGMHRQITLTTPAAGADLTQSATNGVMWKVRGLSATFTASAAVANRFPCLQFVDVANKIYYTAPPVAAVTASQVIQFSWFGGANAVALNNIQNIALPADFRLSANNKVRTVTTGIDAGDQWSNPRLDVEQWVGV